MIAWVISGGGARIVQAQHLIEEHLDNGYPMPDLIVGSSAGGLLAFLISHFGIAGSRAEILKIKTRKEIFAGNFGFGWGKLGLWSSSPLQKLMQRVRDHKPFVSGKNIPYYLCSYDICNHKNIYFTKTNTTQHLASTACIPILVEPIDGWAVDGGLTETTPLKKAIELGASEIHVFQCSADEGSSRLAAPKSKIELALRCFEAMRLAIAREDISVCLKKNMLSGYRHIKVTHHVPANNVLGVIDFEQISNAYHLIKRQK